MSASMNEFEIIQRFFMRPTTNPYVLLNIGDDCAITHLPAQTRLATTVDSFIAGIHCFDHTAPREIGHKALAKNLSDLAAMGATPQWLTLALTLPEVNDTWLTEFSQGFFHLADRYQVSLIGGNLARGPLNVTIQAMGFLPPQQALTRKGAKPGDLIYVTHTLGDAGLALQWLQNIISVEPQYHHYLWQRWHQPEPRILEGLALLDIAHAAIDISDGLVADLNHILQQSHVGARIYLNRLPLSAALQHTLPFYDAIEFALSGGDDYELCFTLPPHLQPTLVKRLLNVQCIGEITASPGLAIIDKDGLFYQPKQQGYRHF